MKVIIINSLYYPYRFGGAEVSVQMLSEELVRCGNKVKIITLNDKSSNETNFVNGVEVVSLPLDNVYWPFNSEHHKPFEKIIWHLKDQNNGSMIRKVDIEIDKFRPDVIHTNNLAGFSAGIWKMVKKKKIPLVHTARDYYLFHPNSTLFKNGNNMEVNSLPIKLLSFFKLKQSYNIDVFVGISKFVVNLHKNYGFSPRAKFKNIYNPVNKLVRNETEKKKLTVGFLGRLTSEKGFDIFIDYAGKFKGEMIFSAAGKSSSSQESKELLKAAKLNDVEVLGYVPVEEYLSSVDVLLIPTKWNEPFGRVVAEAALAGVPVYSNLNGGIQEISSFFEWVKPIADFNISNVVKDIAVAKNKLIFDNPFDATNMCAEYLGSYQDAIDHNRKFSNIPE